MINPRIPVESIGADAGFRGGVLKLQPELLDAFLSFYGALWSNGEVEHVVKELVRLRNARITDCGY